MEIKIVRQILEWNEDVSNEVKNLLLGKGIFMINVMGSPGAGKTSLIIELISKLRETYRIGVIEGDIAGKIDAEKIDALGIPVVQLNTDGACHIEAMSISHILPYFDLDQLDILFVENIGEDIRIAILSIPEGDDKVEKYPLMFSTSEALVLNKHDMIEHFDFDETKVEQVAKDMNPKLQVFRVSTRKHTGVDELVAWIEARIRAKENQA